MNHKLNIILFLCVLCVSVVNIGRSEDWPSLGRDTDRSRNTVEQLSDTFSPQWRYAGTSEIVSSPAVLDGFVVIASRDGYIRGLRESDGSPIWSFPGGTEVIGSPAIYQGRVYVAANHKIYCLRLSDGTPLWNHPTDGIDLSSPVIVDNILYIGLGFPNQHALALNLATHEPVWQQDLGQIVYSSAAISDNKVIIGSNSGSYYALDNANSGTPLWCYDTHGAVLLSAPLISGTSVYLLPGGDNLRFYRIDIDSAQWPVLDTNWVVTPTDTSQPGGTILGTKLATSAPIKAGGYIAAVIRFDYLMDTNADGSADQYILNEYLIAVNPATRLVEWQEALGNLTTDQLTSVPGLGLCPTPASFETASDAVLVAASSLTPALKIINITTGGTLNSYALDAPTRSSPTVANGQILIGTQSGSVYAFQNDANHAPAPPTGSSPNNVTIYATTPTITVTVTWNNAADAEDVSGTLRYLLRVDNDNEVLENYDTEILTDPGVTSATLSAIPDGTQLVYALRTIDPSGAYSGWSALRSFRVEQDTTSPEPATNLRANANNGYVDLYWTESPSDDIKGYLVAYKPSGGSFGPLSYVGNVTSFRQYGLTNGIIYVFQVVAEDYVGWHSTPSEVSAMAGYTVFLNGNPYELLTNALAVAQGGDTITLGPTTFVLQDALYLKEGVSLKGVTPHLTFLDAAGLDAAIQLSGPATGITGTISHLMIYGASAGVDASGYTAAVQNTVIKGCSIAVYGDNTSNLVIINNTILNNGYAGIYVAGNTVVRNNIVNSNSYGIYWWGNTADLPRLVISYNDLYGNTVDYVNCSAGFGDIAQEVLFLNDAQNDYREQADAPTIDMGAPADDYFNEPHPRGTRVNLGAYGNTPYAATSGPFHIATTTLSDGETNALYSVTLGTVGGSGPITWSLTASQLPPGLALEPLTGQITGTIQLGSAGTYNFSGEVVDYLNVTDTANYTIMVNQAANNTLHFATNLLPNGEVRSSYQAIISVADGFPPYTWSIIAGALPPNMLLNSATGEIIGTPLYGSNGNYTFTVRVTDTDLFSVTKTFTIKITAGSATGSSGPGSGKDWCFIATAAYGSPLAPSVKVLRCFRDNYLLTNNLGQCLIAYYYEYSPPLARYISGHTWARISTRVILLPAIVYSWFMVSTSLAVQILFCLVLVLTAWFLLRRHRRIQMEKIPDMGI